MEIVASYEINGLVRKDGPIKGVTFVAAGNGIFRVDDTPFGKVITQQKNMPDIPEMKESLAWELPKIPIDVLNQIIAFFRSLQTEAYVQIYWDKENSRYVPFVPTQSVTGGSVNYELTKEDQESIRNLVKVAEIHSHVDMDAFFSGTDDRDEQGPLVYGVIGHVHTTPNVNLRAKVGDEKIELSISDVFTTPSQPVFPSNWVERVKERIHRSAIGFSDYGDDNDSWYRGRGLRGKREKEIEKKTYTTTAAVNDSDWEAKRRKYEEEASRIWQN